MAKVGAIFGRAGRLPKESPGSPPCLPGLLLAVIRSRQSFIEISQRETESQSLRLEELPSREISLGEHRGGRTVDQLRHLPLYGRRRHRQWKEQEASAARQRHL